MNETYLAVLKCRYTIASYEIRREETGRATPLPPQDLSCRTPGRKEELPTWNKRGATFEGLVIEELAALAARQLLRPELFFWRTQAGAEVDLLIVEGKRILPVEIKLGASIDQYGVAGLRQCMADLGLRRGWVVSTAGERRRLSPEIEIIPWADIASGEIELF